MEGLQKDNSNLQTMEELKREKVGLERDLVTLREENKRLSSHVESLQEKLSTMTQEVREECVCVCVCVCVCIGS